jgi:hypothetical protein
MSSIIDISLLPCYEFHRMVMKKVRAATEARLCQLSGICVQQQQ